MYSLKDVINAQNIVVFGASRNSEKPGSMLLAVLVMTGFNGRIAGINPQGGEIHGVPLYRHVDDVPFEVDIAVMIIPPAAVVEAVRDCARKGVKGVIISSEGFSESGDTGRSYQNEIKSILRDSGLRAIGPNTLGILNTQTGLTTSYYADAGALSKGVIGFAAQSGIFVGAFMRYLGGFKHLGISKGMGLGNKMDINECDALDFLADDDQTRIIGLYLEDIRDGRKFLSSAKNAAAQKPVLLIKGGRTSAGSQATASHTASLAVDDHVLDGALAQAGVLRLSGIEEMLAALMGFTWMPLPKGNRIAIVTYSGAQSIMCVDLACDLGLELTRFGPDTRRLLSGVMANEYKYNNPIDIFPDMLVHGFDKTMAGILDALLQDETVHGVIVISFALEGDTGSYQPLVDMIRQQQEKPVFFSLLGSKAEVDATGKYFLDRKIPYFLFPEMGVRTMANMWRYRQIQMRSNTP